MSGRIEAIYDFPTVKGVPRIRKVRREAKRFVMQSAYACGDGKYGWTRGITDERVEWSTRALFKLPEVVAALRVDVPVWWCEGEKDAVNAAALGFTATSTWQGARGLYAAQCEWFTKYRTQSEVVILCDNDAPGGWFGYERYRLLIDAGVGSGRITVVAPPVLKRKPLNDITDALDAGLSLSDMRRVDLDRLQRAAEAYGAARAARYNRRRL